MSLRVSSSRTFAIIFVGAALCISAVPPASGRDLPSPLVMHVAKDGNDAWSGELPSANKNRSDGPFATLERARDAIRQLKSTGSLPKGGVIVEVGGGVYELARPLELVKEDSGTEEAPIIYRARKGADVRLVGGKRITGWKPVTQPAVLALFQREALGNVWQADLAAQGVEDLGEMKPGPTWGRSEPGLEFFFNGTPMTLARWPNEGFVKIGKVLGPTRDGDNGCREGIFTYEGDQPTRWIGQPDIMLHGFWARDWADQRLKVGSIDTERRIISLQTEPQHQFGFKTGHWYYAYNLLPELDLPGEWYLDRRSGILYFWPPSPMETGEAMISVLPHLVTMTDVANVTLRGMILEGCRSTAARVSGGVGVRLVGCTIRNAGGLGVEMNGRDSGIVGCDLYNLAGGGVTLAGGERRHLTPGGMYVDNCHFFKFGRWNPINNPGVFVDGVGNRVTHSLFHDAPHTAVMWTGNDHTFEFNEFHSVVQAANDGGIMYSGYNPSTRGHVIRFNFFHDVYGFEGRGCIGVYLDDSFCSATIVGNVFYRVPRAAFIGGGHDNVVENNIFVDCMPALHVDARMMGWASSAVPLMKKRLEEVPYREEPWRSRYPELLTYLEGNYAQPRNNLVARNICWGGAWDEVDPNARPGVRFVDNLINQDPRFVDAGNQNFELRADSPAWNIGFQRIPMEKIGLYPSEDRASWPVKHEVKKRPTVKLDASLNTVRYFIGQLALRKSAIWAGTLIGLTTWAGAHWLRMRRFGWAVASVLFVIRVVIGFVTLVLAAQTATAYVALPRRRTLWPLLLAATVVIETLLAIWNSRRTNSPAGRAVTPVPKRG